MNKILSITGPIGLLILSCFHLTAQEREVTPVALQKITDHVYQVNGGQGSNGGAIIGENAVLLIDSKMNEESVNQTISAIKELTDTLLFLLTGPDYITGEIIHLDGGRHLV